MGSVRSSRTALPLLGFLIAAAAILIALAGWLVLRASDGAAGGAAGAAALILAAAAGPGRPVARPVRFAHALVDRCFDGWILSAIAWSRRLVDPATAALAVVALSAVYLSAYIRARGASLRYVMHGGDLEEALEHSLISLGLLLGLLDASLWAVVAIATLSSAAGAGRVARQGRR